MNKHSYSYDKIEKELKYRIKELNRAYRNKNMIKALSYLRFLSYFLWQTNYQMTCDEVEEMTVRVAYDVLGITYVDRTEKCTVFFYDIFGLCDRGLAIIYLDALLELGYHISYVTYEGTPMCTKFAEHYGTNNDISCIVIPRLNIIDRMKKIQEIIKELQPSILFLYTMPDDVAGVGVFSTIKGNCKRYLIDLTDHEYWLGKCAVDYIIGFRNYGYNIAAQYRKVPQERILLLPYYPAGREQYMFEGLPFCEEHKFIFSGGALYKIQGGNNAYIDIVDYILSNYKDVFFVYAGGGIDETLNKMKEKYPTRFFQIGERRDLEQIMKRAYFYLSTYPITGGLMTQYACKYNCLPLTLCDGEKELVHPRTYLQNPDKINFVFYNKEDLCREIDKLMVDKDYYESAKVNLQSHNISEKEFVEGLGNILQNQESKYIGRIEEIDLSNFLRSYRNRTTYERYCELIYNSHNKYLHKHYPLIFLKGKLEERKKNK